MKNLCLHAFAKLRILLLTAALCVAAVPGLHSQATAAPICVDDFCIEIPTAVDYEWKVRTADFDNNGLTDLYVRGGYMAFADPFLVLQTSALQFALAVPTQQQYTQARSLPVSGISVWREELNNDGYLDFTIENIDSVIPNAPDLMITTTFGDGTTADRILPLPENGDLEILIDNLEITPLNVEEIIDLFRGQHASYGRSSFPTSTTIPSSTDMCSNSSRSPYRSAIQIEIIRSLVETLASSAEECRLTSPPMAAKQPRVRWL